MTIFVQKLCFSKQCITQKRMNRKLIIVAQGKLPDSGYFSEADPKAEVYSPLKGKQAGDITKRGDRYTSDFIWNLNWQEKFDADQKKFDEELENRGKDKNQNGEEDEKSGFLSLNRVNEVYNVDQTLDKELSVKQSTVKKTTINKKLKQPQFINPPTQAESRRWSRGGKFGKRSVAIDPNNPEEDQMRKAAILQEQMMYEQLKQEFQFWTLTLTAVSFAATYTFYTKEIAVSYLLGAIGGLVYLRLLNKSVDGFGGGLGGMVGQPRLLIPVILVLSFNRWNQLYADDFDLKLQLLPTLIGFFTYKGAVVARQSVKLFQELAQQQQTVAPKQNSDEVLSQFESREEMEQREFDDSARSVDRAFVKKILTQ
eukprot:TRINITY_DN18804_c0_g2_i1.p1 TRINITY_DN18804_c0_g2~~TRINITY_DN18804_c0_g2_i1.p1  ORF type:complete len:369 (-),score=60.31 TRINITY_DN18804_c0_g2_i1:235-1341(-)